MKKDNIGMLGLGLFLSGIIAMVILQNQLIGLYLFLIPVFITCSGLGLLFWYCTSNTIEEQQSYTSD